jgi:hypothetical protein
MKCQCCPTLCEGYYGRLLDQHDALSSELCSFATAAALNAFSFSATASATLSSASASLLDVSASFCRTDCSGPMRLRSQFGEVLTTEPRQPRLYVETTFFIIAVFRGGSALAPSLAC